MAKQELEYGKCRLIANRVEAMLVNIGLGSEGGMYELRDIANDFLDYLEEKGLSDYWRGSYEISSIWTHEYDAMTEGMKFSFVRLVTPKNSSDSISMGAGTQWVSDVITLMKEFLLVERENYSEPDEDNEITKSWPHFHDSRLIFRVDDKQFDWK